MIALVRTLCLGLLFAILVPVAALAVLPDEVLDDPALEQRARDLSAELRCMVCQNQSIDDSDAELARDLRILVRERLRAGDSNEQVLSYIVSRYGEFVLLRPQINMRNALLWGAPLLLLGLGGVLVAARFRRHPATLRAAPLSEDERKRLDDLLGQ